MEWETNIEVLGRDRVPVSHYSFNYFEKYPISLQRFTVPLGTVSLGAREFMSTGNKSGLTLVKWERSGRVLDSRLKGRGFKPHRCHCVVSLSKKINPSLVLVQPRKTRPFITERLLTGRKELNQTKQTNFGQICS